MLISLAINEQRKECTCCKHSYSSPSTSLYLAKNKWIEQALYGYLLMVFHQVLYIEGLAAGPKICHHLIGIF